MGRTDLFPPGSRDGGRHRSNAGSCFERRCRSMMRPSLPLEGGAQLACDKPAGPALRQDVRCPMPSMPCDCLRNRLMPFHSSGVENVAVSRWLPQRGDQHRRATAPMRPRFGGLDPGVSPTRRIVLPAVAVRHSVGFRKRNAQCA